MVNLVNLLMTSLWMPRSGAKHSLQVSHREKRGIRSVDEANGYQRLPVAADP